MIDLEAEEVQEITSYFSYEVNNLLFNPNRVAEEQKDSLMMKELDICWIKMLSGYSYRTDLRNEASARVGRQLADIPFVKKKMELVDNQKMEEVAKEMAKSHKTLQQTFSGLIFYHFLQSCSEMEAQTIIEVMGNSFYELPLI